MRDWELVDSDRFSFEDSDRFEEDSLCSWISEPESLCNNWRGWKKSQFASSSTNPALNSNGGADGIGSASSSGLRDLSAPNSLVELAAKCVASHIPFEMVERVYPPVPEQLQLRIAFWSFPEHEEDIRLYSCLANGSAEEFQKGEKLYKNECVSDILQIGFHLSATVKPAAREAHKVAVTFDRTKIVTCQCSCNNSGSSNWCGHIVAVCLHRIYQAKDVTLRAPVSESLSRLHRDQLQKFAQYLISELPQQILPTAQRLLDDLLSNQRSDINTLRGAPDPTAGASANEQTTWFLDEKTLHGNIHKILIKFCVPAPIVFSDVNYLSSAAPPASAEWSSLLRPLRGREPEGMWNLLSIVREMFRREDRNGIPLLEVITEECLNCDQILVWWFNTKVALHNGNAGHGGKHHSVNSNAHACQHAGSSLCDEIVVLWRLAALNPGISPEERNILLNQFKEWHMKIIEKVSKSRNASVGSKHANSFKNDVEVFPGFRPAIEACYLTWENYPIPGVTYSDNRDSTYHCPFMWFRHSDGHSRSGDTGLIHSSHAVLNNPAGEHHLFNSATISSAPGITTGGGASSSASKRPRSVDCGQQSQSQPSNASNATRMQEHNTADNANDPSKPGPSSSFPLDAVPGPSGTQTKPSKTKSRKARNLASASGLKPKTDSYDSSFEGEIPGPSSATTNSASAVEKISGIVNVNVGGGEIADLVVNAAVNEPAEEEQNPEDPLPARDRDNRSSVSSEGFCDNENEIPDLEVPPVPVNWENDEGVETDAKPISNQPQSLNTTTSEDNEEVDNDNDADNDSDSSIFIRSSEAEAEVTGSGSASGSGASAVGLEEKFPAVVPPDSSDSQQSGDEYQLYYYDPKSAGGPNKKSEDSSGQKKDVGSNVFSNLKRIEDPWDVLFARAEGLHAHGHSQSACKLGVKLGSDLLANPPKLTIDVPPVPVGKGKRKKVNPISHQVSCLASATLSKSSFLCTVMAEDSDHYYLAFQVGMFGLEMARPPASTKPLEVKLANQEAELAQLLKRIPIGGKELEMIREKAEALKNGTLKSRGEALLPLVLANFIFDVLVMPANREGRVTLQPGVIHLTADETLGFEAAVSALGLKANVSEADHPLLCEGTRRQRGDLALAMLLHYKDEPDKLAKIMDKLLDREIHQLYKAPLPPAYYSNNPPTTPLLSNSTGNSGNSRNEEREGGVETTNATAAANLNNGGTPPATTAGSPARHHHHHHHHNHNGISPGRILENVATGNNNSNGIATPTREPSSSSSLVGESNGELSSTTNNGGESNGKVDTVTPPGINGNNNQVPPSSSNTPSAAPSTSGTPPAPTTVQNANSSMQTSNGNGNGNGGGGGGGPPTKGRYKGKRHYPVLPNQPSEASAHFMFELAKIVLGKAGGSSNQSLFTQPSNGQNPRGPHRALHMCAFHIGLYALGLHNAVSPNWLSRTYSSHVSWITGQAMEIGAPAIAFLIDTWDSHLTPPEAVTIADRASRGDVNMVRAAAELALSCLPYAQALNPNEIHRAILQCKEQSDGMLEKACLTVETAAKSGGGGVYPEVLFDVARQWFSLYQKHLPFDADVFNDEYNHHDSLMSLDGPMDPLNTNAHGQLVSPQTGLPPLNPNNPPPPPPSVSSSAGPSAGPDMIQLPHPNGVYPMSAGQVPLPYGQVPYLPTNFANSVSVPANFVYGGAVIYQANPGGPGQIPTTTSGGSFFNPQQGPQPQCPQQPGSVPQYMPPNMHPQFGQGHPGSCLPHNMVSAGPPLQFYPAPTHMPSVVTSVANHGLNMRPGGGAQFFPHHNNPQVAVVSSQHPIVGLPMPPVSHHQGHLVGHMGNQNQGMPHPNPGPNPGMMNPPLMGMPQGGGGMPMMGPRGPGGQPQMAGMGGNPVINHHNGMFLQGNNMVPPQMHPGNMPGMPMADGPPPTSSASQGTRDTVSMNQHQNGQSAIKIKYLLAAYRVGMLAMEALARRVHDDRPQSKYARNPPYGEDVKWLLSISRKLGAQYLQQFCLCAVQSISNPFVLHEIVLDASMIPTRNNLTWVYQNSRSPLAPLVQKCQQMYLQCLHTKLYHITASDHEEFVGIVCMAKQAFHLTPDGISQFKEWLSGLRRSKTCKKELWSQITAALQSNPK